MPVNTSFSGINQQLDLSNTAPITIDDTLVRALTGLSQDIPSASPISFADLAGKLGVGPIIGPISNSQASYFTTNAVANLQFVTDIYQANIVWSYSQISGDAVTFTSNASNAAVLLSRSTIGNSSANVGVTATLYYGNTLIGSNTVYVNLQATVYNSNLVFTSAPTGFVAIANGYAAQTALLSVTAQANVPNGTIQWSVTPNTAGAVSINGNTVTLSASSAKAGVVNSSSYQLSATVLSNGQPVVGAGGGVTANVTAYMYSGDFIFTAPANVATASNTGPLTISAPFTASGNAPGTVITWGSSVVSGSTPTFTVASGNLSANLSLLISPNNSVYGAANTVVTVTANMYSDATLTTLVSSHSANVSLQGLVYGMSYSPPPTSNIVTGFTAQTASSSASATYQAGTFNWSYSSTSGIASITKTNGSPGGTGASISFVDSVSGSVGSNASSWIVTPTLSYGSITITGSSTNAALSATVQPYSLVINGATSNTQYANNGPLTCQVGLSVSGNTPPGTNVVWSASQVSGSAATFAAAGDNQSSTLTLSLDANTFTFANAVYNVTANCYDTSTGWSLNSNTRTVTLNIGTYGLTTSVLPVSNTQSGYTAQTATASATASVKAGTFAWWYANTTGVAPTFSLNGVANSSTGTWTQKTTSPLTNTVTEQWQIAVYSPANTTFPIFVTAAQTFSLTAQQNAYSFTLPSVTTNTQLLGSATSNLTLTTVPTSNITGYSLSGWASSNTSAGYTFTSNSTAAIVGFNTTLTAGSPVAYYTTTVSGNLLDSLGRLVQSFSYPVVLRSYFPNPVTAWSNSGVTGYTAQTASGSYTYSIWSGATSLSVGVTTGGNTPTLTNGTQNTSYWAMSYTLATGSTYQNLSGDVYFTPTISFYEKSTTYAVTTAALTADNYNPAPVLSSAGATATGWTGSPTAYGVVTASANASISGAIWTWGALQTTSGAFTGAYLQGTGNNQYVAYDQISSIGTAAATGNVASATLYVNGTAVASTGASPSFSVSATKYNPALVISGPTSNTQSAQFTSTATITLTASANASIPGVSYQCSASPISGSAAVSIPAGNTSCTLSVTGLHVANAATYNVTFSVLSNGTVLQTSTQQVTLSATGTVPNYTLTTPSNVSAAGFNFAQTCSSTAYLNGLTGSGDYATWNMTNVSGTTPAWSTPGGSNGYITTTQSCGSIGSVTGTIYQLCNVYDPSGNFITQLQSGNYALTSTVYNPAFTVSSANGTAIGWNSQTATATVSLSANASLSGQTYTFSWAKLSGNTANSVIINTGNTGGSISVTESSPTGNVSSVYSSSSSYRATVSCVLNGQTISGPTTTDVSISSQSYAIWAAAYTSTSSNTSGSAAKILQTNYPGSLGTVTWTVTSWTSTGDISGTHSFSSSNSTGSWIGTVLVGGATFSQKVDWTAHTKISVAAFSGTDIINADIIASAGGFA